VHSSKDPRCQFQDGWWPVKLPFLLLVSVAFFLVPSGVFEVYGAYSGWQMDKQASRQAGKGIDDDEHVQWRLRTNCYE